MDTKWLRFELTTTQHLHGAPRTEHSIENITFMYLKQRDIFVAFSEEGTKLPG